ncbi:signal transduction histidine kinase [Catenulispora sp. GP43]|uniref:sensor histidine kinase n=1 Tax=Catenulispora sp. GP43 TaxID=3156263 RepID=UPI0035173173
MRRPATRARTALAAGLAALTLLGIGALFLRQHVYDSRLAAGRTTAQFQARTIASRLTAPHGLEKIHADTAALPSVVLNPSGDVVRLGDPLSDQQPAMVGLPWPDHVDWVDWSGSGTVHVAPAAKDPAYAGRTFAAVGAAAYVTGSQGPGEPEGVYTVYVLVTPFDAQAARAAVDPALWFGVPAAALLVGVIAWAATSRALRPVEAIRAQMAAISEHHLDRRVPVPPARDEISRMAVTTNATLDRLQHSAEQQRRFVADAAHELRSPIAALRTNLEVSLAHPEHTDWPTTTGQALAAVRRLQTLAEDLLYLARPGDQPRHTEPVDPAELAHDLLTEYRHTHTSGPHYTLSIHTTGQVRGNRSELNRLLRNLLDNATRHAASRVAVTIAAENGQVLITVDNDGSDIPTADRQRIFERFTRLDESRSRDAGGTGLGLALARAIAEHHGGALTLAASGPTFTICLPVAPATYSRNRADTCSPKR